MAEIDNIETDNAVYKTLLESTRAIPWKIELSTMKFTYIGPQIEALLGWSTSSWISVDDWAERIHPDDRGPVVNYCLAQSQAGTDHETDYRALRKDGGYVWIRDVIHVVRKDGEVDSLVGFMFDISERKKTEDELIRLQKELEELSFKDALTGIANRRMFDSIFEREWSSARRNGQPVSLILLDVDCFKEYNDHYGHVNGDDCLRSLAQILNTVVTRPRDFVARYGGEEFVLVLAETSEESAYKIAEKCRSQILEQAIPHVKSKEDQVVTISAGVSTVIPSSIIEKEAFIQLVDRQLYKAKESGRNCVVSDYAMNKAVSPDNIRDVAPTILRRS